MKLYRTLIVMLGAVPLAFGANKETIELQRDVMTLQDQVRQMNDKLVTLTTLLQSALDNTKQSNVSILSMQDRMNDALKRQQEGVSVPIANVGAKLDQMSEDFRAVRETVLDLNSRMNKLDAKITDLQNTQNVIRNPPPAPAVEVVPQGAVGGPVGGSAGGPVSGGPMPRGTMPASTSGGALAPPPGMGAESTYTNAYRDYVGGQYDLAMQEFTDYLKYFPTTQFAPNAQYYVGDIYYKRKDYDGAIQAFDAVLEHFSDNSKTPDAHLMKGRSLLALGKRDAAAREFREINSRYPDSDASAKAKSLLKELGLSSPSAAAPARPKPRRRR